VERISSAHNTILVRVLRRGGSAGGTFGEVGERVEVERGSGDDGRRGGSCGGDRDERGGRLGGSRLYGGKFDDRPGEIGDGLLGGRGGL
jgi:hypothetical protein